MALFAVVLISLSSVTECKFSAPSLDGLLNHHQAPSSVPTTPKTLINANNEALKESPEARATEEGTMSGHLSSRHVTLYEWPLILPSTTQAIANYVPILICIEFST